MSEAEFYIIYVKFTSLICISFVTSLFRSNVLFSLEVLISPYWIFYIKNIYFKILHIKHINNLSYLFLIFFFIWQLPFHCMFFWHAKDLSSSSQIFSLFCFPFSSFFVVNILKVLHHFKISNSSTSLTLGNFFKLQLAP